MRDAAELEAKALFEYLLQKHPGDLKAGRLETFQRRVQAWQPAEGPDNEVSFTQKQTPGKAWASDWTERNQLNITIQRALPS